MVVKHSLHCHQLELNALEEIHVVDPNQNGLALKLHIVCKQHVNIITQLATLVNSETEKAKQQVADLLNALVIANETLLHMVKLC